MDADLGSPAHRAPPPPGHPGAARRPLVRRRRRLHRRPSWASSTPPSSRSPCPRCSGPSTPSVGAVTWVGLSLSVGAGGDRDRGRPLRRHVGPQAPLRLRLRHLHRRLGAVRPGARPGRALRLPGAPGGRCRHAAGQQPGHHRAGRARAARSGGPSGSRARRRPSAWPSGRSVGGSAAGRRRVAADLLRQRPLRASSERWRRVLLVPRSRDLLARVAVRLVGARPLLSRRWWHCSPRSPSAPTQGWTSPLIVGLFAAAAVLGRVVRLARAAATATRCSTWASFATGASRPASLSGLGSYLVMFGVLLLVPFYLERGPGFGVRPVGPRAHGPAARLRRGRPLGGPAGRPGRRPAPHGERHGAGGCRAWLLLGLLRPGTAGFLLLLAAMGVGHGPVHLAEQRVHHGRGARAAGRHGLGCPQHDPRHRAPHWAWP